MTGKSGAGLKSIMEESGARIRVGHEEELPPQSKERCVRCHGSVGVVVLRHMHVHIAYSSLVMC